MKKKSIFFLIIAISIALNINAQHKANPDCKLDNEKIRAEKVAFLTSEIDLSVAEAQKFWPIYNQMNEELDKLFTEERDINYNIKMNKSSLSDKEISEKLDRLIRIKIERVKIEETYHKKFCEVLPISKVASLYEGDRQFRKHLLQKYKNHPQGKGREK